MRRFWIVGVVVGVLVAWGGFAIAGAPLFRLHELSVTGLDRVSREDVLARANIDRHANVWLFDRHAIARRIEAIPYVATVRIHRRPLANVWLDIVERTPDGCVRSPGGIALTIDRDDRVLERGCAQGVALAYELHTATDVATGRYVRNGELSALQDDARALASRGDRFRMLRHDPFGQLEAELTGGILVRFGDDRDVGRKLALIGPILGQLGGRMQTVRALDLRSPSTPVVEFRPIPAGHSKVVPHTQYTQGTHSVHHNM